MLNNKIFVSIANYRDPEIQPTIIDLFTKADNRDMLVVGVLSQIDKSDIACTAPKHHQVKEIVVDRSKSQGVCWARSRILTELREDEYYTLQIDSHTRFVQGWDTKLKKMLEMCGPNSVITHYPCNYAPPNTLDEPRYLKLNCTRVNGNKIPVISAIAEAMENAPTKPELSAFYSGNMSFTHSSVYDKVPYDPYLYFLGEEISMAVRLWTSGINLYTPNEYILWHRFNANYNDPRPIHWKENNYGLMEDMSRSRVRHVLGIEACKNLDHLVDILKYGLGTTRSLREYQTFAGLYFKTSTIEDRCKAGKFQ